MVFSSGVFLVFFIVFYSLYLSLYKKPFERKILILFASYIFYGWWDWRFLSLISASIVVNYYFANRIRAGKTQDYKKRVVSLAVIVNLVVLGIFKYFDFFVGSFLAIFSRGVDYEITYTSWEIILPVGISFFTFQAMSYVIDTYRNEIEVKPSLLDFAVYISMFPQLVAGPIVRASYLLPQIQSPKLSITPKCIFDGAIMIVWGLFLKIALAENAAPLADAYFNNVGGAGAVDAYIGIFAFAMQIYGDFAGYSLMAIGIGKWIGYDFGINFRRPYFAISFSDFWRRWHISLSSWLRDYLYITLGGNRGTAIETYRNLFITMLLGGLWHGASWNFVIWGGLHGLYLVVERLTNIPARVNAISMTPVRISSNLVYSIFIFLCVCFSWIFFRANSISDSILVVDTIFTTSIDKSRVTSLESFSYFLIPLFFVILHDMIQELWEKYELRCMNLIRAFFYLVALITVIVIGRFTGAAFIYFQF